MTNSHLNRAVRAWCEAHNLEPLCVDGLYGQALGDKNDSVRIAVRFPGEGAQVWYGDVPAEQLMAAYYR